ncbi:gc-rich sequence dna-binding factor-like protein [Moniliophthora roreri MCA 2997]|uniref:Gc-rich sequence dna-binding factor-like protein n=1 Tax=Moniliophthora roreri (strain MCA 2997) TaxID=1381753 RepID=V2Y9T8_MONRO|nr:gc-rich sequence dna-binding factor-like protein [Moniliophthora roreri MCA 2997]KAI3619670.1 gc-rich sequence dna-binding factor-like protein [Moniliophthora roreri]
MFKQRTKSKPAQRTRPSSPEEEDNESATVTAEESPSTLVKKFKDKTKRNGPKSRLSFGGGEDEDEEGGEAFRVKKSKLSRKLTLGKHPVNIPTNLDQATISASRPTYDQAYLNELKAKTPSARAPILSSDPYDADMSVEVDDIPGTSIAETSDIMTIIPSESSIRMAKERRERLRASKASGNEDFISLSVTKSEYQGPHPESRLMREEDELGEADEEYAEYTSAQERIALSKKSRKAEATKRREAMKEMIADANEEDEETAEWEQEQLRRGGHIRGETPSFSPKPAKRTYKPAPIPPVTPIPTLSLSLARLTQQMSQLTTSHANNTAALNTLAQEREQVDEREKEMRDLVGKAEEKRAWFGSFREWIEGVAGFLDEKYPMLEKLEEEHISLLKERFDMINNRRQQDDEDDLSTFLGPLPPAPGNDTTVEETDELGRTIPKSDPVALRRQRRSARSVRHQERQMRQKAKLAEEGYSTDSEIPTVDEDAYRAALRSVATRTRDVLSDVKAKEFLDPGKGQWSVWREKYMDSYVGAWGGLGVVSVWEFWARLECVGWDCIEEAKSFDSFRWYQGLYDYCRPGDTNNATRELGPDGDLVSSMITTAIIPRLSKVIEGGALDVYSHSHIRRAIDLMEEIEASIEKGSPKLQILTKSVVVCFERAIYETEKLLAEFTAAAVTRTALAFDPESVPSRQRFLTRRVKLLSNLLRWRKSAGERFGLGQLAARIVDGLVVEIADEGWEVGGADVVQTVAGMLPPELVTNGIKIRLNSR